MSTKQTTRGLALALIVGLLSGCGYTYHFRDNTAQRGEEHNEWASYFLFGIVGDHEIAVRDFCPNGAYEITTGTNFLTWLTSGITLGIYTPRKVNIWCKAGPQPVAFEKVKRVAGGYGLLVREGEDR